MEHRKIARLTTYGLLLIVAVIVFAAGYSLHGYLTIGKQSQETQDIYLPVYGMNDTLWTEEIRFYFRIPGELPLRGQLEHLADQVSVRLFGSLPIEVMSIEDRDSKRVAIINLRESGDNIHRSWRGLYFQGSTGAHQTTIKLRNTFLQPDYKSEWIDGVQFYYEGKPMPELGHNDALMEIIWRDTT